MPWQTFIAFGLGVIAAAAVGYFSARRALRRVRGAEQRARAAERMAELGSMTAGLAHEIKNPLSTLGLNAQLLREAVDDLPDENVDKQRMARRVDGIGREADRLRGILEDFLSYAGELRFEREAADLNVVASEIADFFLPQAERAGVRMRVSLQEDGGALLTDIDIAHTKQALLNLILNAVQAMEADDSADKELILRTDRSRDEGGAERVRVQVVDTGPGMDAEMRQRAFRPYETGRKGGTGLGLPTTRRLVEGQGGRLELHSEPGKGTEFTVSFSALPSS